MALALTPLKKPVNDQVVDPSTGLMQEEWKLYFQQLTDQLNASVGALGIDYAPADAQYYVAAANSILTNERVVTLREVLLANRTYYVRTDGSDSNTGLVDSAGGAFLTVQKAVDVVYSTLDLFGFDVDIQVRDGTFARAVVPRPQVGKGTITLRGNSGTPANVTLTSTTLGTLAGVIDVQNSAALHVQDLTLTCSVSGQCLFASAGGVITFQNVRFGTCAEAHMLSTQTGRIAATGDYSIVGNATRHWWANDRGGIRCQSRTITLTGTPAFSSAFCLAESCGVASVNGNTFSGSATGVRFVASRGGQVVALAGLTELPGNAAGTADTLGGHPALVDYVTDAQVRAATAGRFVVTADKIESASALVTLTDAATIAVDWDSGINFIVTVTANRIIGTPTNAQPGTWRTITVLGNDATDRTITFSADYRGEIPVITDVDSGRYYLLMIMCLTSTHFVVSAKRAFG